MFERISRSWDLVKASFEVLKADKELIVFPVVSTIGLIIVTICFAIPLLSMGIFETLAQGEGDVNIVAVVIAFLFYLVTYTVIIFSNTALIGAAMIRLRGGDPTVSDGFRIASERFGIIVGYAMISATVGMILNAIRESDNILANIAASLAGMAWNLATFLVIPVLVVEDVGPIEAVKRSAALLKKTWGEQIVGNFSMSMIFGLLTFAAVLVIGVPLIGLGISSNSTPLVILGVGITVILVAAISLFGSALSGIYQAAVYLYATEGEAGDYFEDSLIRNAFRHK